MGLKSKLNRRFGIFFATLLLAFPVGALAEEATDASLEWGSEPEEARQIYADAMGLLQIGKQSEAEELLDGVMGKYWNSQRIVFLRGVLGRSRFSISGSKFYFLAASRQSKSTPVGRAAWVAVLLDMDDDLALNQNHEPHFEKLRELIRKYPDELLFRWLFAIQCRAHRMHAEEACEQYRAILAEWNPGPVMVVHTYANILTESLKRPDLALPFRERALELEPKSWVYQGYANTLRELKRNEEASAAFEKAVELKPDDSDYWRQWGYCHQELKDYERAIELYAEAAKRDPTDSNALQRWADCLESQGKLAEAFEMYLKAYEADPSDDDVWSDIAYAYEYGQGTDINYAKAMQWYEKLLENGSTWAAFRIGYMHKSGRGVEKDSSAAMQWFFRAAAAGSGGAMNMLGYNYAQGDCGVEPPRGIEKRPRRVIRRA